MIFKTTILRSNPQIIRVFEINAEEPLEFLLKVVAIIHGWKKTEALTILKNGKEVSVSEQISAHFSEEMTEDEWEIQKNMPEGFFGNRSREPEKWHFRLEVVDYSVPKDLTKGPGLIRYRGLNPNAEASGIRAWNELALALEKSQSHFDYGLGYIQRSTYELKKQEVSSALKRLGRENSEAFKGNLQNGFPLEVILERYKLDELKQLARSIFTGTVRATRKQELIDLLKEAYNKEEILEKVLEKMPYQEYEHFQAFLAGEENDFINRCSTLLEMGLAYREAKMSELYIAQEFVDYYKAYMEEQGDEELVDDKKTEEVLLCAGRLYGMFTWHEAYDLGEIMYPELEIGECLEDLWYPHGEFEIAEIYDDGNNWGEDWEEEEAEELMYHRPSLQKNAAVSYWNLIMSTEMVHYLPSREEAFKIAREGLTFSEKARKEILEALKPVKKSYRLYRDEEILNRIYQMCHMNMVFSEYASYLKRAFSLDGKATDFAKLVNVIRNNKDEVRQVLFCGHTSKDAKRIYHLELQER